MTNNVISDSAVNGASVARGSVSAGSARASVVDGATSDDAPAAGDVPVAPNTSATSSAPTKYERLTFLMCLRLAAPHTWPGPSILPTIFGGLFAILAGCAFSPALWCLLLAVAVFAQSAVNTLNDWADFKKGTDTLQNCDDPSDAVLVYHHPNPKHVLVLALVEMVLAFVCGLTCCIIAQTLIPLIIGIIGAIVVVIYSNAKLPISYLPLGELVSGVVMGLLIPLADVIVLEGFTKRSDSLFSLVEHDGFVALFTQGNWLDLWGSTLSGVFTASASSAGSMLPFFVCVLPFVIGIALIMATQNTCDIERDKPAGRHTLSVLLGRKRARALYCIFLIFWIALVLHCTFWYFNAGFWVFVITLIFGLGSICTALRSPLDVKARASSMAAINKANLFINGGYILAMMYVFISPGTAFLG